VEHDIIKEILDKANIPGTEKKTRLLEHYAELIYETGGKMNLTGYQTKSDILHELILSSFKPFIDGDVPRGTYFADIGSGQGVPGIPVAIIYDEMNGVLIDSNARRIAFIDYVKDELRLDNVKTVCGRVEELAHRREYRERFDAIYARAMGQIYLVMEMGSALVAPGGVLYLYSKSREDQIEDSVLLHGNRLNLVLNDEYTTPGIGGIAFTKTGPIDHIYPRRHAAILRESRRRGC
jgi:16S rRNA (guanine527-N7)-methyltransferase